MLVRLQDSYKDLYTLNDLKRARAIIRMMRGVEMRVRDLIDMLDVSVDVCDDYDERCYIGYESGYDLTEAGEKRFAGALDVPIYGIQNNTVIIHCPTVEEAQACKELFYSIAGYCSEKNFDRWFRER